MSRQELFGTSPRTTDSGPERVLRLDVRLEDSFGKSLGRAREELPARLITYLRQRWPFSLFRSSVRGISTQTTCKASRAPRPGQRPVMSYFALIKRTGEWRAETTNYNLGLAS